MLKIIKYVKYIAYGSSDSKIFKTVVMCKLLSPCECEVCLY